MFVLFFHCCYEYLRLHITKVTHHPIATHTPLKFNMDPQNWWFGMMVIPRRHFEVNQQLNNWGCMDWNFLTGGFTELQSLTFGRDFHQTLKLPITLEYLICSGNFSQRFFEMSLPDSLRSLTCSDSCNEKLEDCEFAKKLEVLTLEACFNHFEKSEGRLPEELEKPYIWIYVQPGFSRGQLATRSSESYFWISFQRGYGACGFTKDMDLQNFGHL